MNRGSTEQLQGEDLYDSHGLPPVRRTNFTTDGLFENPHWMIPGRQTRNFHASSSAARRPAAPWVNEETYHSQWHPFNPFNPPFADRRGIYGVMSSTGKDEYIDMYVDRDLYRQREHARADTYAEEYPNELTGQEFDKYELQEVRRETRRKEEYQQMNNARREPKDGGVGRYLYAPETPREVSDSYRLHGVRQPDEPSDGRYGRFLSADLRRVFFSAQQFV